MFSNIWLPFVFAWMPGAEGALVGRHQTEEGYQSYEFSCDSIKMFSGTFLFSVCFVSVFKMLQCKSELLSKRVVGDLLCWWLLQCVCPQGEIHIIRSGPVGAPEHKLCPAGRKYMLG